MAQMNQISPDDSRRLLENQKFVLQKVTYCQKVFETELEKAKRWLLAEHFEELIGWVVQTFEKQFSNLRDRLKELFSDVPALAS